MITKQINLQLRYFEGWNYATPTLVTMTFLNFDLWFDQDHKHFNYNSVII